MISNLTNQHRSPVGASLLANALGQAMKMLTAPPSSRASSLPHWILRVAGIWHTPQKPVGASLLANALGQAMKMLNVPPSSRAGSLPHWILRVAGVLHTPQKSVGVSLLANASGQAMKMLNVPPSSRAGSLLQGPAVRLRLAATAGSSPLRSPAIVRCAATCSAGWHRARADTTSPPTCAHRPRAGFCHFGLVRCIR